MSQQAAALAQKGAPWRRGVAWWIVGLEGAVLALVGIYVIADPDTSRDIVRQIIGAFLLANSGLRAIAGFRADNQANPLTPYRMLAAGVGLTVGLLVVVEPASDFVTEDAAKVILALGLLGYGAIGLAGAYFAFTHVARRIKRFLDPASGDTFQIDNAVESFVRGGWLGRGPGEGTVKRVLPDSHADFVFAVAAEEFGIVLCLVLVALFAFVVLRALTHALRNDDPFTRFAAAGLAILFGLQSAINMSVNLHLIPAKGMTLPFISYGGSSMLSLAYGMGMLIALTRERPRAELLATRDAYLPALGRPA